MDSGDCGDCGSAPVSVAGPARLDVIVEGVVQGVGFRPYVYRLATELGLSGSVGNDTTSVVVDVQGQPHRIETFLRRLPTDAPPLARITAVHATSRTPDPARSGFTIGASRHTDGPRTLVPPDSGVCDDCHRELADPADRRYRHPFITCVNCGPRFTIIRALPYDRPATSMAGFPMCHRCAAEYHDPADRRFHAQPLSCPDCGPRLWFTDPDGVHVDGDEAALTAAARLLAAGGIVAVKGIGGYHLACVADQDDPVARLRDRKGRGDKPFAVMVPDVAAARRLARCDQVEEEALTSPARPIVLLRRRPDATVSGYVAPGNPWLGVLLPYSPLHHLLFDPQGTDIVAPRVLVLTSGNLSDEPICFDDDDARNRLAGLADAFLGHTRPIVAPCDDSVIRVVAGVELPLRRSRGYAPLPVDCLTPMPPVLAVGAEIKNTSCLTDGAYAFLSQHLGDMGGPAALTAFERNTTHLATLYNVTPNVVATDAHPGYRTHRWALEHQAGRVITTVQHHHAHVVSLLAEHGRLGEPAIGVAFDGTGYARSATATRGDTPTGRDQIWGGELLGVGHDPSRFRRLAHLREFDLPGGDAAVRHPRRVALALLAQAGVDWDDDLPPVVHSDPTELRVLRAQLDRHIGTVPCTSVGRLFDAVAALLDLRQDVTYEAQAAIELEGLAADIPPSASPSASPSWRFTLTGADPLILDPGPVLRGLVAGLRAGTSPATLAAAFHTALADAVADTVALLADRDAVTLVGLTGGVFQNAVLTHACQDRLTALGLEVLTHRVVPPNDGGLSLGQAVIAAAAVNRTEN